MNTPVDNNETCQIAEGTVIKGEFKTTANINGTFHAGKLIVDEGALMNGECHIGGSGK